MWFLVVKISKTRGTLIQEHAGKMHTRDEGLCTKSAGNIFAC